MSISEPRASVAAVIFDFGQVLVHFESENMLSPYLSSPADRAAVAPVLFDRVYWDKLDAGTASEEDLFTLVKDKIPERLRESVGLACRNWFYHLPEIGGMRSVIRSLKIGGTPVYVLSNISRGFARHDSEIPILSEVDGKVYSSVCGYVKPSRGIFAYTCERFSLDPARTLFVDGNPKNVAGASEYGLLTYLFDGDVPKLCAFLREKGLLTGRKTAKIPAFSDRSDVDFSLCEPLSVSEYVWGGEYRPAAECRLALAEDDALFIRLSCDEKDPLVRYHGYMDPVWTDSCLEFFFSVDGSRYVNVEMNAGGGLCSCIGEGRKDRIPVRDVCGDIFPVTAERTDAGWSVTAELPLSMLGKLFGGKAAADTFRRGGSFFANAYKCGDETEVPHFGSWNPVLSPVPDFHRPESFGQITIGD